MSVSRHDNIFNLEQAFDMLSFRVVNWTAVATQRQFLITLGSFTPRGTTTVNIHRFFNRQGLEVACFNPAQTSLFVYLTPRKITRVARAAMETTHLYSNRQQLHSIEHLDDNVIRIHGFGRHP